MKKILVASVIALSSVTPAHAAVIFDNRADFEAATADLTLTTHSIDRLAEGAQPSYRLNSFTFSVDGGEAYVRNGRPFCTTYGDKCLWGYPGENFATFSAFPSGTVALGFDIFTMGFRNFGIQVQTSDGVFEDLYPHPSFFGVLDQKGLMSVSIRNLGPVNRPDPYGLTYGLDNISVAAVPEPATWMMMIAGFGFVGAALRSRRRVRTAVSFA